MVALICPSDHSRTHTSQPTRAHCIHHTHTRTHTHRTYTHTRTPHHTTPTPTPTHLHPSQPHRTGTPLTSPLHKVPPHPPTSSVRLFPLCAGACRGCARPDDCIVAVCLCSPLQQRPVCGARAGEAGLRGLRYHPEPGHCPAARVCVCVCACVCVRACVCV